MLQDFKQSLTTFLVSHNYGLYYSLFHVNWTNISDNFRIIISDSDDMLHFFSEILLKYISGEYGTLLLLLPIALPLLQLAQVTVLALNIINQHRSW